MSPCTMSLNTYFLESSAFHTCKAVQQQDWVLKKKQAADASKRKLIWYFPCYFFVIFLILVAKQPQMYIQSAEVLKVLVSGGQKHQWQFECTLYGLAF